ncbi:MAG: DUF4920 domain-containing protein [bacterium]|nr:DUF4920 domain-containing protein [bacterium]
MKKTFLAVLCMLAVTGISQAGEEGKVYGDGVKLDKAMPIATLTENPEQYAGKTLRVDGVITGVCEHRGCWMQISDPDSGLGVRVKVEDGVMVFPATSQGHRAQAQGVFEVLEAEVEAEPADKGASDKHAGLFGDDGPKTCTKDDSVESALGCDPVVAKNKILLLRGTGAVIF